MARSYTLASSRAMARLLRRTVRLGPHIGAGQGLGVEAAVRRGFVFGAAVVAERKISHRGVGPVVGHGRDDGVARAALGAIDEGVAAAPLSLDRSTPPRSRHRCTGPVARGSRARWRSSLGRISKATGWISASAGSDKRKRRLRASGGAEWISACSSRSRVSALPSAWMKTLPEPLSTDAGDAQLVGRDVDERPKTDPLDPAGDARCGGRGVPNRQSCFCCRSEPCSRFSARIWMSQEPMVFARLTIFASKARSCGKAVRGQGPLLR